MCVIRHLLNKFTIIFGKNEVVDFQTSQNNFSDINECTSRARLCTHKCYNLIGGYQCACHKGFKLHSNKRSCVGWYTTKFKVYTTKNPIHTFTQTAGGCEIRTKMMKSQIFLNALRFSLTWPDLTRLPTNRKGSRF